MNRREVTDIKPVYISADRIKEAREEKGISLNRLAQIVGITYRTAINIEKGRKSCSPFVLRDIACELGVSTDWLLELSEKKELEQTKADADALNGRFLNVRFIRTETGTKQELADKIGISAYSWNRYETGDSFPTMSKLVLICSSLGVSSDYLLELSDVVG
ncbi:helix-turn-helix domain-containing protein [Faecalibaculum rodentium]|uniref:helix-turn-helix domain-containing protein n=1 Tax=Faecalibaculum rodentium TaxID=1702221 RepID=UPI0025AF8DAB|nr:helix-turn-helix transcriptional regulator [Faecalibaculum rodentium]